MKDYRELAHGAAKGDQRAFAEIYNEFHDTLLHQTMRLFPWMSSADVEDCLHETFLEAFRNIRDFRGEWEGSLPSWLKRINLHQGIKKAKEHNRHKSGGGGEELIEDQESPQPSPEDAVFLKEIVSRVRVAIDRLSEQQKSVVIHRDLEEQSVEECADTLGIAAGTVSSHHNRAKKALRTILREDEEALSFLGLGLKEPTETAEKTPKPKPKPQ